MRKEYAFQGSTNGAKSYWSDAWATPDAARKAAREWVSNTTGRSATIFKRVPLPPGHEFGARWEIYGAPIDNR